MYRSSRKFRSFSAYTKSYHKVTHTYIGKLSRKVQHNDRHLVQSLEIKIQMWHILWIYIISTNTTNYENIISNRHCLIKRTTSLWQTTQVLTLHKHDLPHPQRLINKGISFFLRLLFFHFLFFFFLLPLFSCNSYGLIVVFVILLVIFYFFNIVQSSSGFFYKNSFFTLEISALSLLQDLYRKRD